MEKILCLIHTEPDGSLHKSALEAVGAARDLAAGLSSPFSIGIVGESVADAANAVAGAGAEKIYAAQGADFAQPRYASDVAACEAIAKAAGATMILAAATSRFSRVMAGVTSRLGGRIDTQATGIDVKDGKPAVTRWYYRQRIETVLSRPQRPWVVTISPGSMEPISGIAGAASVEAVAVSLPASRTQVSGIQSPPADAQTIRPDAQLLFVAGAGWTKQQADGQAHIDDAEQIILKFLHQTGASLGSSKSLVDMSGEGQKVLQFMSHLNQIGQTGASPRHPKGLATCCHGEEPHVVGWRFINERRAINTNAACGWAMGKADVLYVADAFAVMRKVEEMLG
ncbi:MAG: electron transfer flavoprotein subunit alpha [Candidatus Sumerlaeia bacterium]